MQAEMIWKAWADGRLTDADAQAAAEAVQARKQTARYLRSGLQNLSTASPKRRVQRSPDRQRSIERRRRLASSGPMPPQLACQFTVGELAVLRIVADEARQHGGCRLHIDAIAARAGVCRTTAQNAIRQARRLGLVTVQERRRRGQPSDTNIVRIVSREWQAWLERGPRGGGLKFLNTTDTRISKQWKSVAVLTRQRASTPSTGLCG